MNRHHPRALTNEPTRSRLFGWTTAVVATSILTACANLGVEPWERDYLNREEMLASLQGAGKPPV